MAGGGERIRGEEQALALARARLAELPPEHLAGRAGVSYRTTEAGRGAFEVAWLAQCYAVSYPDGLVVRIPEHVPARTALALLLLHYLTQADGTPLAGRWVAFRELPDGLMYDSAFRARVEPALLAAFGEHLEAFRSAARVIGGTPLAYGDASSEFALLPRVHAAVVVHCGDDELPPAVTVLFDAAAGRFLPAEDLAVAGGMLVGALLKNSSGSTLK